MNTRTYIRRAATTITALFIICITLAFGAACSADADIAAARPDTIYNSAPAVWAHTADNTTRPLELPAIQLAAPIAAHLNHCADQSSPVWIDAATGNLYGDQDGNGILDGDDCNWS